MEKSFNNESLDLNILLSRSCLVGPSTCKVSLAAFVQHQTKYQEIHENMNSLSTFFILN